MRFFCFNYIYFFANVQTDKNFKPKYFQDIIAVNIWLLFYDNLKLDLKSQKIILSVFLAYFYISTICRKKFLLSFIQGGKAKLKKKGLKASASKTLYI